MGKNQAANARFSINKLYYKRDQKMIYLPYVYKVTNRYTLEFYIGMRSANTLPAEQDLGVVYFTSNKTVRTNFSKFDIEILGIFIDQEAAFEFENSTIEDNWGNSLLLNKHYQKIMSSFSMVGVKRPDLSKINKLTKSKPKEDRIYQCTTCGSKLQRTEFCHHLPKEHYYCNATCRNNYVKTYKKSTKGIPNLALRGKPSWNKGLPNATASENGKKSAAKQSGTVKGRKIKTREDGTRYWVLGLS